MFRPRETGQPHNDAPDGYRLRGDGQGGNVPST